MVLFDNLDRTKNFTFHSCEVYDLCNLIEQSLYPCCASAIMV